MPGNPEESGKSGELFLQGHEGFPARYRTAGGPEKIPVLEDFPARSDRTAGFRPVRNLIRDPSSDGSRRMRDCGKGPGGINPAPATFDVNRIFDGSRPKNNLL